MAQDPFMVRALARHIAADLRARGFAGVEVRADAFAAINGHPAQRLVDPRVDLAAAAQPGWILPRDRMELRVGGRAGRPAEGPPGILGAEQSSP